MIVSCFLLARIICHNFVNYKNDFKIIELLINARRYRFERIHFEI